MLGIEADIYATGIKGSFSGSSTRFNDIRGFLPDTIITVPGQEATVSGSAVVKAQEIKIEGQTVTSTGNLVIPPQGLGLTETITGLKADSTLHKGTPVPIVLTNADGLTTTVIAFLTQDVKADSTGKAVIITGVGGNVTIGDKTFTTTILTPGGTYPITVTGTGGGTGLR